jgi:hypothetical protein
MAYLHDETDDVIRWAEIDGQEAARAGKPIYANPHHRLKEPRERRAWRRGYLEASLRLNPVEQRPLTL